ncbi:hypothetical protein LJR220_007123 [Bradyrhizobium sp. LjRoot220]|uniref:hypothetical protein n=1 Tax=Bradyrhizobium sp. LjRoot220 TaxID=3342284 RepID=UPI003ECE5AF9
MTDDFKREIERLLDEPAEPPAAGSSDRLRARLAATLSEGLAERPAAPSSPDSSPASVAAFIDGRLSGAARDRFASALAREPGLRAEVESAADLVYSVADHPVEVPKHLLARAGAQFTPAPPPPVELRARWWFSFADLLPRQRLTLALVAALALIVTIPAGLILSSRFGGPGEPELSGVSDADTEAARLQACKEKEKNAKAGKTGAAIPERKEASSNGAAAKDPCDPPEPKRDGAVKK